MTPSSEEVANLVVSNHAVHDFAIWYSIPSYAALCGMAYLVHRSHGKPMDLSTPLWFHNLLMIFMSVVLLVISIESFVLTAIAEESWNPLVISWSEAKFDTATFSRNILIFQVCKVAEWLDTVLLILRGKSVKSVHWFHHGTISLAFYAGAFTPTIFWIAGVNSVIHIIMYSYYAKIEWIRPFARHITRLQIFQLFGSFVTSIAGVYAPVEHKHKIWASWTAFVIACGYLALFIGYYAQRYMKVKAPVASSAAEVSSKTKTKKTSSGQSTGLTSAAKKKLRRKPKYDKTNPLYIRYQNKLYDCTDFMREHPGGSVILSHAWSLKEPVDSTNAILALHQRAMPAVAARMRTLPLAPAALQAVVAKSPREAVEVAFTRLRARLLKEGWFEPSKLHIARRVADNLCVWGLGLWLLNPAASWPRYVAGIAVCAVAYMHCGWLQHEGGHGSLTGSVACDRLIQAFYFNIVLSGNFRKWNHQHFGHHAATQHVHDDIDLKTMPLVAFNEAVLSRKSSSKGSSSAPRRVPLCVRYQHLLYWLVINPLVWVIWAFFSYPYFAFKKGHLLEYVATRMLSYSAHVAVLSGIAGHSMTHSFLLVHAYSLVGLSLLLSNFTVSHTTCDTRDHDIGWVRPAAYMTKNCPDSIACNWWMGYLNFQIEHHLFPTMQQFRHAELAKKHIIPFFKKHNLPYQEVGFFRAHYDVYKNLERVANHASRVNAGTSMPPAGDALPKPWQKHGGEKATKGE